MSFARMGTMGRGYGRMGSRNGAASGLTGDVWANFISMPNGAPLLTATGQPFIRQPAGTNIVQATVSNGALVAGDSGQSTTAAYTFIEAKEDVKSFYTDVSFGDVSDVAALVAPIGSAQAAIGSCSAHIIFQYNSWAVQYFSSATGSPVVTTVGSSNVPAVAFGAVTRVGWRIDASDVYLIHNGVEYGPVSASAVTTRSGNVICLEHYRPAAGPSGLKFYGFAAGLFADAVAAGHTNLLAGRNSLANAAWIKALSGPTSGFPDAGGGTLGEQMMEVASPTFQWFYQQLTKAATIKRYSQRSIVELSGRDWMNLFVKNGSFADLGVANLNLTTRTLGTQGGSEHYAMIYPLANGFAQVQQEFLSDADTTMYAAFGTGNADNANAAGFTGDITKGMIVYDQYLYERPR